MLTQKVHNKISAWVKTKYQYTGDSKDAISNIGTMCTNVIRQAEQLYLRTEILYKWAPTLKYNQLLVTCHRYYTQFLFDQSLGKDKYSENTNQWHITSSR